MAVNLWPNADVEAGIDDWNNDYNCTISQSTTQAWEQSNSLKCVSSGWGRVLSDSKAIISESTEYTASAYFFPETDTHEWNFMVRDQDSNLIATVATGVLTADTWTRVDLTFTTGSGDTGLKISFEMTADAARTWYVDGFMVETGSSASTWVNYSAGSEVNLTATIAAATTTGAPTLDTGIALTATIAATTDTGGGHSD